jgi:diguanylate cyclase (GGDEF)-like protein
MSRPITILNVEDDDDDAEILQRALSDVPDQEYQLHRTGTLAGLPGAIAAVQPDVILLDLHLPDGHGTESIETAIRFAADVPVLVLTGNNSDQMGRSSIEAGVQDFIPKSELFTPHLRRSIDFAIQRKKLQSHSERRAMTDPLTGLMNRTGLMRQLAGATARVKRHGGGFGLMFVDLDGFKAINDRYGHAAGDEILIEVSRRAEEIARANDSLCRLGGDEFVFCLDGLQTRSKARQAGVRYAGAIERPILLGQQFGGARVIVSASIGLAVCPKDSQDANELMSIADKAMYERKRARREAAGHTSSVPPRPVTTGSRATLGRSS